MLALGLGTRLVALLFCLEMLAISYALGPYWPWIDRGIEYPVLMGFLAFYMALRGGGAHALDRLARRWGGRGRASIRWGGTPPPAGRRWRRPAPARAAPLARAAPPPAGRPAPPRRCAARAASKVCDAPARLVDVLARRAEGLVGGRELFRVDQRLAVEAQVAVPAGRRRASRPRRPGRGARRPARAGRSARAASTICDRAASFPGGRACAARRVRDQVGGCPPPGFRAGDASPRSRAGAARRGASRSWPRCAPARRRQPGGRSASAWTCAADSTLGSKTACAPAPATASQVVGAPGRVRAV